MCVPSELVPGVVVVVDVVIGVVVEGSVFTNAYMNGIILRCVAGKCFMCE